MLSLVGPPGERLDTDRLPEDNDDVAQVVLLGHVAYRHGLPSEQVDQVGREGIGKIAVTLERRRNPVRFGSRNLRSHLCTRGSNASSDSPVRNDWRNLRRI